MNQPDKSNFQCITFDPKHFEHLADNKTQRNNSQLDETILSHCKISLDHKECIHPLFVDHYERHIFRWDMESNRVQFLQDNNDQQGMDDTLKENSRLHNNDPEDKCRTWKNQCDSCKFHLNKLSDLLFPRDNNDQSGKHHTYSCKMNHHSEVERMALQFCKSSQKDKSHLEMISQSHYILGYWYIGRNSKLDSGMLCFQRLKLLSYRFLVDKEQENPSPLDNSDRTYMVPLLNSSRLGHSRSHYHCNNIQPDKGQSLFLTLTHHNNIRVNKAYNPQVCYFQSENCRYPVDIELVVMIVQGNNGLLDTYDFQMRSSHLMGNSSLLDNLCSWIVNIYRCMFLEDIQSVHSTQLRHKIQGGFRAAWELRLDQNSNIHSNTFLWEKNSPCPHKNNQVQSVQSEIDEEPVLLLKVPTGHNVGREDPRGQYAPFGQIPPIAERE